MSSNIGILPLAEHVSNGHASRTPTSSLFTRDDSHYLTAVAKLWLAQRRFDQLPAASVYRLEKLPDGYQGVYSRRSKSSKLDQYLYGHRNGRFDSVKKFMVHFLHLMETGSASGCQCVNCVGNTSAGGTFRGVATENTPAPDQMTITRMLGRASTVSAPAVSDRTMSLRNSDPGARLALTAAALSSGESVTSPLKPDIAEVNMCKAAGRHASHHPRLKELILFPGDGNPAWEVGVFNRVVTTRSGTVYEVQSYQSQPSTPRFLASCQVFPLSLWDHCIAGLPEVGPDQCQEISDALSITATYTTIADLSLTATKQDDGVRLSTDYGGIYIGPELIVPGDAVKIVAAEYFSQKSSNMSVDAFVISAIRGDRKHDETTNKSEKVRLVGLTLTLDEDRAFKLDGRAIMAGNSAPAILQPYGDYFFATDPDLGPMEVPYHRALGRYHEDSAMIDYYGLDQPANAAEMATALANCLQLELQAAFTARCHSKEQDARVGATWYRAATRDDQLYMD